MSTHLPSQHASRLPACLPDSFSRPRFSLHTVITYLSNMWFCPCCLLLPAVQLLLSACSLQFSPQPRAQGALCFLPPVPWPLWCRNILLFAGTWTHYTISHLHAFESTCAPMFWNPSLPLTGENNLRTQFWRLLLSPCACAYAFTQTQDVNPVSPLLWMSTALPRIVLSLPLAS